MMLQATREQFVTFLQGKGLEGKPVETSSMFNPITQSVMQFVDTDGIVQAQAIYTAISGEKVSVRYEIRVK